MGYQFKKWHGVAALSAAGVLVLPAFASAQTVDDLVDQFSVVNVDLVQVALSNSGLNFQDNTTAQGNDTVQLADSSANGGDADATSDSDVADALAGFGGASAAANAAESANDSTGGNSQTTGAAVAANAVSGSVSQSQDNSSDNLAFGDDAEVLAAVIQTSEVNIGIVQAAVANSGLTSRTTPRRRATSPSRWPPPAPTAERHRRPRLMTQPFPPLVMAATQPPVTRRCRATRRRAATPRRRVTRRRPTTRASTSPRAARTRASTRPTRDDPLITG